jgi:hypothetical protein
MNWPVDVSMRLEFRFTTGAQSAIETLERKCRHLYVVNGGVHSYCKVSLLCLSTLNHHSNMVAGCELGPREFDRPLPSRPLALHDCDEGEARSRCYTQEERGRKC